jgi:hypothetical protein
MCHVFLDFLVLELSANQAFECENGIGRIDNGLTLSGQANQSFTVFCESDNGRGRSCTLCVLDNSCCLALHYGDAGICSPKVNTDNRAYIITDLEKEHSKEKGRPTVDF